MLNEYNTAIYPSFSVEYLNFFQFCFLLKTALTWKVLWMKYLISNNDIARLNNRQIFKFREQDQIIFQETNTSLNIATIFHWMWLFFLFSSFWYIHILNFNVVEFIDHFLQVHRNSFLYLLIKASFICNYAGQCRKNTNKQINKSKNNMMNFPKQKKYLLFVGIWIREIENV